jgi:sec-independent protein translocase protein TatC
MREHIIELRKRLLLIVSLFLIWCGVAYTVRVPLTQLILKPLGTAVYYNTPQGGFEFFMRVIMTAGFICVVPVIIHQLISFVEPAVGKRLTPKKMRHILFWSLLLAIVGIVFGYLMILPTSLTFFGEFGGQAVKPLISADAYLNFVLGILATFAFLFQLPLIISIIDHIRPIKPDQLTRYRRHVIVGSLVIALLLPFTYDPVTQFVIALPIVVLYELSIQMVRWNHRTTRAQKRQQRIASLVEALREADELKTAKVTEAVKSTVLPATTLIEAIEEQPEPEAIKTAPRPPIRVLVGPTKMSNKPRPQVLDLRGPQQLSSM